MEGGKTHISVTLHTTHMFVFFFVEISGCLHHSLYSVTEDVERGKACKPSYILVGLDGEYRSYAAFHAPIGPTLRAR